MLIVLCGKLVVAVKTIKCIWRRTAECPVDSVKVYRARSYYINNQH